jgi:hypothetical protein
VIQMIPEVMMGNLFGQGEQMAIPTTAETVRLTMMTKHAGRKSVLLL